MQLQSLHYLPELGRWLSVEFRRLRSRLRLHLTAGCETKTTHFHMFFKFLSRDHRFRSTGLFFLLVCFRFCFFINFVNMQFIFTYIFFIELKMKLRCLILLSHVIVFYFVFTCHSFSILFVFSLLS